MYSLTFWEINSIGEHNIEGYRISESVEKLIEVHKQEGNSILINRIENPKDDFSKACERNAVSKYAVSFYSVIDEMTVI